MQIMLVEDDPLLRETVADHLSDAGYDVQVAATAEDALDVMAFQGMPSLVLTDIDLGTGMSGLELAARLRSVAPQLGLIVITGRPECLRGRHQHPRERCFAKPVPLGSISSAVSEMLPAS